MTTTSDARETVGRERLPEHAPRLNLRELVPDVYKALFRLETAVRAGLDPTIYELVKIRASQINKCAFCLDMHVRDARKAGESDERIFLLDAWEETDGIYTDKERAALALTEAVTVLTDGFVPDAVYARAAEHFDEAELPRLVGAIVAINAWNRFNVTFRTPPGGGA